MNSDNNSKPTRLSWNRCWYHYYSPFWLDMWDIYLNIIAYPHQLSISRHIFPSRLLRNVYQSNPFGLTTNGEYPWTSRCLVCSDDSLASYVRSSRHCNNSKKAPSHTPIEQCEDWYRWYVLDLDQCCRQQRRCWTRIALPCSYFRPLYCLLHRFTPLFTHLSPNLTPHLFSPLFILLL